LAPRALGPISLLARLDNLCALTVRTLHRDINHRLPPRCCHARLAYRKTTDLEHYQDLDASIHFCRDVLGLALDQRYKTFAMLRAGEFGVYLSTKPWSFDKQDVAKGAGIFPHFEIDNMDALLSRLKSSSATVLQEPKTYSWGKEYFALDPDGYQWSFVELAPDRR
jgi:catechol 2,3-dioxygenase-like lactoylglutathione lyase family enzyme